MRKTPRRCRRMRSTPPITTHTRPRPCASRDSCARLHDPLCRYAKVSSVALRNRVQRRRRMKKRDHRHRHASSREDAAVAATSSDTRAGLIISNYGATLQVEDDDGAIHRCTARKKIEALVCGDRVEWLATQNDEGEIVAMKPRRSLLVRPDVRGLLRPMAANVDQLVVVSARWRLWAVVLVLSFFLFC